VNLKLNIWVKQSVGVREDALIVQTHLVLVGLSTRDESNFYGSDGEVEKDFRKSLRYSPE
jgi:hypothetical protein